MRELLSDVSAVGNMDMLLQYVEESEYVGDVGRTITMRRSAKKTKSKQCVCTAREIAVETHTGAAKCSKRIKDDKVNKIIAE